MYGFAIKCFPGLLILWLWRQPVSLLNLSYGLERAQAGDSRAKFFANPVRNSGKCTANHATFPPHEILAFPTAYNLRTKSSKSIGSERIGPQREILGLFPPWPVNRSTTKPPGILPFRGGIGRAEREVHFETGGWSGIRTHDTLLTYTHFPGARLRPLGHPSLKCPTLVPSFGVPRTISFSPCFNRVSSPV